MDFMRYGSLSGSPKVLRALTRQMRRATAPSSFLRSSYILLKAFQNAGHPLCTDRVHIHLMVATFSVASCSEGPRGCGGGLVERCSHFQEMSDLEKLSPDEAIGTERRRAWQHRDGRCETLR